MFEKLWNIHLRRSCEIWRLIYLIWGQQLNNADLWNNLRFFTAEISVRENFMKFSLFCHECYDNYKRNGSHESHIHHKVIFTLHRWNFNLKYLFFNKMRSSRSHNQRFSIWTFTNSAKVAEKSSNINIYILYSWMIFVMFVLKFLLLQVCIFPKLMEVCLTFRFPSPGRTSSQHLYVFWNY